MKIYLTGKMRFVPYWNFPLFKKYAAQLREQDHVVFNPAEQDIVFYGEGVNPPSGDPKDSAGHTPFDIKKSLMTDVDWICNHADAIALIPGWESSKGAQAEKALAEALGLKVIYLD